MSSNDKAPAGGEGAASAAQEAIRVERLGKCYHIYEQPRDRFKQLFSRVTRRTHYREFWALQDMSFTVQRGQTVGVIGPNGSGKSTLLQLICGTLTKSTGDLAVRGRIAALLELGAGFSPEFTGRENILMNAAILGLKPREIAARYDQIVAFADIGEFVERPVKTYSSGMFVRLAFSVAVNVEPDILVVDEALAVGDIKFQAKCFRKFEEFQDAGKTILFVSHSTEHIVRHCTHAILLSQGRLVAQGEPKEISNRYMNLVFGSTRRWTPSDSKGSRAADAVVEEAIEKPDELPAGDGGVVSKAEAIAAFVDAAAPAAFKARAGYNSHEFRWGERSVEILDYLLCVPRGCDLNQAEVGDHVDLYVRATFHKEVARPVFGLTIKTVDGIMIFGVNSKEWDGKGECVPRRAGESAVVHFRFQALLNAGDYLLGLGIADDQGGDIVPLDRRYDAIILHVGGGGRAHGMVVLPNEFEYVKPS